MGMTDRQFDAFRAEQLRELKRAAKEVTELSEGKIKSTILDEMIKDTEDYLKRP